VAVLLLVAGVAPEAPSPAPGVAVELIPGPGKGATALERLAAEPSRARWLAQRLARLGADALYERLAHHSAAGSDAARALGIPHVVELNAPWPEEAARDRELDEPDMADRLERVALAASDLVLVASAPLGHYARARGARQVELLLHAVALERFPVPARRFRGEPVAVCAGGERPWQGLETVAAAWRLLDRPTPRLLVVGEPGEAGPALEQAGAELAGPVAYRSSPALLSGAQIGLVAYSADAPEYVSPPELFDCMAAGQAVVASDLAGVRELVDDRTALLVPPGDARAFAGAVSLLVGDRPRRERLGAAARSLVVGEHTWARRAQRVLAAIEARAVGGP
jgi:glycosyltransferase involved in cell wall biosynthesis